MPKANLKLAPKRNPFLTTVILTYDSDVDPNAIVNITMGKHGKTAGVCYVKDDAGIGDITELEPIIMGGIIASDGNVYEGLRVDDGTDYVSKPWPVSIAINANSSHDVDSGNPNTAKWPDLQRLISEFAYPVNHGYNHGGYDVYTDIAQNRKAIFDKFGLPTSVIVIPSAEQGYIITGSRNHHPLITSQYGVIETMDGFEDEVIYTPALPLEWNLERTLQARTFTDNYFDTAQYNDFIDWFEDVLENSNDSNLAVLHTFSHGLQSTDGTLTLFNNALHYIQNHEEFYRVGVWNLQEVLDYEFVKRNSHLVYKIEGNKIIINLSMSKLDKHVYYLDTTLKVNNVGSGTLTNVTVNSNIPNTTKTFNLSTNLVNIYSKNQFIKSPYNEVDPPLLLEADADTKYITLSFSEPVLLTTSGFTVVNEEVDNTVVNASGAGNTWILECTDEVTAGSLLYYKPQNGTVVSASNTNRFLPSYIGKPINTG